MNLRRRVHIFQAALLGVLQEKMKEPDNTPSQLAAIGFGVIIAEAIDISDNNGAFAEDEEEELVP